jgi:hypothetical protein
MWDGIFPYRFFWTLGTFLAVVGILGLTTLSEWRVIGALEVASGVLGIVFGFVERNWGDPSLYGCCAGSISAVRKQNPLRSVKDDAKAFKLAEHFASSVWADGAGCVLRAGQPGPPRRDAGRRRPLTSPNHVSVHLAVGSNKPGSRPMVAGRRPEYLTHRWAKRNAGRCV